METIRLIISSSENGDKESILFTDDWNSTPLDLMPLGQTIDKDKTLCFEMPGGFPLNYVFNRV